MENLPKRILVVDDKPNNLSLVTSLLKPFYEVMLANNGERAIRTASEKLPDLILLDIMMPGMSGFEVCEVLKSQPLTALIPIIFLTARNDGDDFEKAYDIGAVDYVTKPVNAKELLMRVRTHLLISEQRNHMVMLNERITEINEGLEGEVKKRTSDLYAALRRLEGQNQDLARFSHIISHNLRGPVASALGLFQLLNMSDLAAPSNGEVLTRMKESVVNIDTILKEITGILDIREKAPSVPESFHLHDAIENCLSRLKKDLLVGTPVITEDLGPEDHIMSVRSYVEEILYRLLHNAWLYRSPEREPDIRVSLRKESGQYFIEVSDNGLGIDPKNWEQIFEPYKRLTYTSAGRGLGLYLARAQAQAIKGTLSVESNPGVGSVFHLVLPDPVVREVKTT
ncbi:MAG: response regulator [Bacteroidota bacterium]